MLLADFAQVSDGKLTVVGGGWSLTGPDPVPFGIAILIRVPWDQANQRHVMRLELLDADGIEVEMETDDGSEPVVFFDDVPFSGRYEWRSTIDGQADDDGRCCLRARRGGTNELQPAGADGRCLAELSEANAEMIAARASRRKPTAPRGTRPRSARPSRRSRRRGYQSASWIEHATGHTKLQRMQQRAAPDELVHGDDPPG